MSGDETPKIEPVLTNAPSIAPDAKPEAAEIVAPKTEPEALKPGVPVEATTEAKVEPEKAEPRIEAKAEAPTLPPAPQIEPPKAIILRGPQPWTEKTAPQPRAARFALLAACVAIAASIGAIGGSLGLAKFGATSAPKTEPVGVVKDSADEIRALKDSIAQLRAQAKSLNDNLASLKTTVTTTTALANQQSGKIAETLERIEKSQAEQKRLAAQAAPETTGSIASPAQKQAATTTHVPMVLGDPPTTLKPPILQDYVLRRVYDGAALIEGRNGIIEVEPGVVAPGIGRIEAIKRQDGRWVVVTARGLIVQR